MAGNAVYNAMEDEQLLPPTNSQCLQRSLSGLPSEAFALQHPQVGTPQRHTSSSTEPCLADFLTQAAEDFAQHDPVPFFQPQHGQYHPRAASWADGASTAMPAKDDTFRRPSSSGGSLMESLALMMQQRQQRQQWHPEHQRPHLQPHPSEYHEQSQQHVLTNHERLGALPPVYPSVDRAASGQSSDLGVRRMPLKVRQHRYSEPAGQFSFQGLRSSQTGGADWDNELQPRPSMQRSRSWMRSEALSQDAGDLVEMGAIQSQASDWMHGTTAVDVKEDNPCPVPSSLSLMERLAYMQQKQKQKQQQQQHQHQQMQTHMPHAHMHHQDKRTQQRIDRLQRQPSPAQEALYQQWHSDREGLFESGLPTEENHVDLFRYTSMPTQLTGRPLTCPGHGPACSVPRVPARPMLRGRSMNGSTLPTVDEMGLSPFKTLTEDTNQLPRTPGKYDLGGRQLSSSVLVRQQLCNSSPSFDSGRLDALASFPPDSGPDFLPPSFMLS